MILRAGFVIVLLSSFACTASVTVEPEAAESETPSETGAPAEPFTPRTVTEADIPDDIDHGSWARLPTIERESLDAEGQRVFDLIVHPDSRYSTGLRGPIGMWMYSPPMAEHLFPASTYLRFGHDNERDQRLVELAILAAARALNSQYEWSAHEGLGRTAGLEEEIIELLRHGQSVDVDGVPGLGETERTIVKLVRQLILEPKVDVETFTTARRLFGEQGLMDMAGLVGHYTTVNYTLKTFDVQRSPGQEIGLPLP